MNAIKSGAARNIKLTIAYDGTEFHGWQIQPGQRTVQGVLTEVLQRFTQEAPVIYGAGRTDAGVHAWGQVAHFATGTSLDAREIKRALNALLPAAIRIRTAEEVDADFHARWRATAKTYVYRIYRGEVTPPFLRHYVLHDTHALDFAAMAAAAQCFEGQHDFSSFAASSGDEEIDRDRTMTRAVASSRLFRRTYGFVTQADAPRIAAASVTLPGETSAEPRAQTSSCSDGRAAPSECDGEEWVYEIRGRSFLRNMVRKIVGTLLDVGRGRLTPADIPRLLELRDPNVSGPTAPPHGLCLVCVEYGAEHHQRDVAVLSDRDGRTEAQGAE